MLTEGIKQSEAYQTFIKYFTGLIPPKKSRGKGSQGKKSAITPKPSKKKVLISVDDNIIPEPDFALELGKSISLTEAKKEEAARRVHATHEHLVLESDEPSGEPANRPAGRRRTYGIAFRDTLSVSKKKIPNQSHKLKVLKPKVILQLIGVQKKRVDEEMKDAEVAKTGKDGEEITYAEKTDAEKTKVTNSDLEQAGKLLLTSFNTEINSVLDIQIQQKQEQAAKKKMPKFSATPYDQATEAEFKQKDSLFKMIREFKSYEKHLKHKALYDALMLSLIQDEDDLDRVVPDLRKRDHEEDDDPSARSNQRKRKRSSGKDSKPSNTYLASKKTSKGNTPPKSSKTGKFAFAEESVKEATDETMGDKEPVQENVNDADQPDGVAAPKNDWFNQPPRSPTPDLEWNSCKVVDDQTEQPWFNNLLSAQKDPLTFDELMANPIDFSKFAMNHLKIEKLTKAHLVGPVYNLLKSTCQSSIELEYNMEECYKALSNQLDWNNPKGDCCPFDLSKPLPLKGRPGHLTVALEYFFNNDLEYLKSSDPEKKYTTSIMKTKAARYELVGIEDMILNLWSVTKVGYDKDAFKEGEFVNLHMNDIEDMLLLVVQHKLFHLDESYQNKLNITKPQKNFPKISAKELHTPSFDPPRVVYADLSNQKRLMQADELYKFLDKTLKKVRDTLHHKLLNFGFGYNKDMPRRKWSDLDKRRSSIMVDLIDKLMLERRILRNLERFIGAREFEMDYRLMQRTTKTELTLEQTQQGVSDEVLVFPTVAAASPRRVRFIATCSYQTDICKDIVKAQVHVLKDFRYSDTTRLP
ncbi:hypothetical protein Tco_0441375 [Tanacetum coccineum]